MLCPKCSATMYVVNKAQAKYTTFVLHGCPTCQYQALAKMYTYEDPYVSNLPDDAYAMEQHTGIPEPSIEILPDFRKLSPQVEEVLENLKGDLAKDYAWAQNTLDEWFNENEVEASDKITLDPAKANAVSDKITLGESKSKVQEEKGNTPHCSDCRNDMVVREEDVVKGFKYVTWFCELCGLEEIRKEEHKPKRKVGPGLGERKVRHDS